MNRWGLWGFHGFSIFSSILETQLPILRTWLLKPNLLSTSDASSSISKNSRYIRRYQCFFFHPQISGVAADSGVFFFRSLWSSQAFDPLAGQWRSQSCGSPSPNPIQWSSQWHAMRIDWAGDTLQYVKALAEGSTWHIYITCKKTRPPKKIKKQMGLPQFPSKLRKWWWYPDFGLWYRQTRIYIYQKTNSPFPYVNISIHIYLKLLNTYMYIYIYMIRCICICVYIYMDIYNMM